MKQVNHIKARADIMIRERRMSYRTVATRMGVSVQSLSASLSRESVRRTTLSKLALAIGVDLEELTRPVDLSEYAEAMIPRYAGGESTED